MDVIQRSVKVPCMQSGDGEDSYSNSSLPQNFMLNVYMKPHLSQALDHLCSSPLFLEALHIPHPELTRPRAVHSPPTTVAYGLDAEIEGAYVHEDPSDIRLQDNKQDITPAATQAPSSPHSRPVPRLVIADFGCAHGHNTLHHAAFILQGIQERLIKAMISNGQPPLIKPIEMQYFFSDLPANNFNSLFQSLQGFLHQLQQSAHAPHFKIFTGAVAGSFHDPLFPSDSLHFAISSYSLHWLSQVPKEVLDKECEAWNGGHIWLHGGRPKVMEAYAIQYQKDMRRFFQNRARELAKGGMLFLLHPCRGQPNPHGSFYNQGVDLWSGLFESTWMDMVFQGLITEDEMDTFNIPFYMCHEVELHEILEEFVDDLEVVKMQVMRDCIGMVKEDEQKLLDDPEAFGKFWANFIASLVRPMVQTHLDEARTLEFFKRLAILATQKASHCSPRKIDILMTIIKRL